MAAIELSAQPRKTFGKKVRFVRREGTIPANLYARGANSMALQLDLADLQKVLSQRGTGGLISLKLTGEKHPRNVIVREVQRDALTDGPIHIDFQQVSLTETLKVEVPIMLTGEAKLPKSSNAVVIQTLNNVVLKGLPKQIPEKIVVDISPFTEAGQAIHVRDLELGEGVSSLVDGDEVVVKVVAARMEVVEEKPAAEVAEGAAAPVAGVAAGKEGAAAGEAKAETKAEGKAAGGRGGA
ncbi:MAG: 50S ribosomal protein L25 [Chloroflexi bacterium]|nr:50S ribosomal protein L25 [Chloroflexota bacterium]